MIAMLLTQLAESDCEAFHEGLLDQPANAWTSLAMVIAALLIAYDVKRRHLTRDGLIFAAAVAFAGVGSFIFHGFASEAGRWAHDVSLLMVLAIIAGVQVGRAFFSRAVPALWSAGVALVILGGLLVLVPDATNVIAAVLVVAIAVSELVSRRRGQPGLIGFWTIFFIAVGVAAFLLGRSDAPLCDPNSELQPHGLWHLLIAVVTMLWADRAFATPDPRPAGWGRAAISRFVVSLAWSASRALLRQVEVVGSERLPTDRPVLIISNHFNGFVDPVLVIAALGKLPRFLAKGTLWNIPPAGALLTSIGVLPVHRPEDREGEDNTSTFAAAHNAFGAGDWVALFPEGTTGDRAQLDRVRTGTARIALGAVENGITDLAVVAVGLAYENRLGWRSRVLVEIGEPLDVAAEPSEFLPEGSEFSEADHPAVDALTAEVDAQLRAVAPNYADVNEREALRMAAGVALRDGPKEPSFAAMELEARAMGDRPQTDRTSISQGLADYMLHLRFAGLSDRDVAEHTPRGPLLRALLVATVLVIAMPVIIVGLVANIIPFALVRIASRRAEAVVTKGTVRLVVGMIAFPLSWIVLGYIVAGTTLGTIAVAALLAVAGLLTIWLLELARSASADVFASIRSVDRRSLLDDLAAERAELVALVDSPDDRYSDSSESPSSTS